MLPRTYMSEFRNSPVSTFLPFSPEIIILCLRRKVYVLGEICWVFKGVRIGEPGEFLNSDIHVLDDTELRYVHFQVHLGTP